MDIVNFVIEFVPETITLLLWLVFLSASGLIYYWLKNKNDQSHEVPESLVRNYQESMLGNYHASESDYHSGAKNASILRSGELKNQAQVASVSNEQLNQLSHEILELKEMVKSRDKIIEQLEERVPLSGSSPDVDTTEFDLLRHENQELESKLKEYELLEDDLDTLRDLRIENKDLRSQLNIDEANTSENGSEVESHEVNGSNEDEGVFVVSGEDSEESDIHLVKGQGEDSLQSESVTIEDKDIERESVDFSGEASSFGKVKVKGGSLFGRESSSAKSGARSSGDIDIDDEIASINSQQSDDFEKPQQEQAPDDNVSEVQGDSVSEVQDDSINESQEDMLVEEAADLGLGSPEPNNNLSEVESEIESALAEEDTMEMQSTAADDDNEEDTLSNEAENSSSTDEEQESGAAEDENIVELNPVEQPDHQDAPKKDSGPTSDKSAEELLDEFEKMLG